MCARCGSFIVYEHAGWFVCHHCGDTWPDPDFKPESQIMKILKRIKMILGLTRRYDVPSGHTWAKASIEEQRVRGRKAASRAEVDEVIKKAGVYIVNKQTEQQ